MKLPTIPPGLAGKIVKKLPALGTNQIAGFGEFRPLTSLEKNTWQLFDEVEQNIVIVSGEQINYLPKPKAEANN